MLYCRFAIVVSLMILSVSSAYAQQDLRTYASPASADDIAAANRLLDAVKSGETPDGWERQLESSFEKIAQVEKRPAWLHYGRALIEAAEMIRPRRFVVLQATRGSGSLSHEGRQKKHLQTALDVDSTFEPALLDLARLADRPDDTDDIAEALRYLDRSAVPSPHVAAAAIDLELARDSLATADRRVAALPTRQRESPVVQIAAAIAALRSNRLAEGEQLYRDAVRSEDPTVLRRALNDLTVIRRPDEPVASGEEILKFWNAHSNAVGLSVAERLSQHYKRIHIARRTFYRRGRYGAPDSTAVELRRPPDELAFDVRGMIYIRRGEPAKIINTPMATAPNEGIAIGGDNESWIYETMDGVHAFHFMRAKGQPDWGLSVGLLCNEDYLTARLNYDRHVASAMSACRSDDPSRIRSLDFAARETLRTITPVEGADRFTREIPFYYSIQNLKIAGSERPEALIVAAVPVGKLVAKSVAQGFEYRFQLIAAFHDSSGTTHEMKDTTITVLTKARLNEAGLLRAFLEMPAMAGDRIGYGVRLRDMNADGAGRLYAGMASVSAFARGQLGLSDLILTRPTQTSSGWRRGAHTLDVIPMQVFENGELGVYFELYHAAADTDYRISVRVVEESGRLLRRKESVEVTFTEQTGTQTVERLQLFKTVNLQLAPGKYKVQVRVQGRGQSAMRERLFEIPKP